MDRKDLVKTEPMEISWQQQKLIANPLRSQIIALLFEQPMTPKQTADLIGKNPGTIYYHIQQLVKHDILEVDHIHTEKGIVEKYYRAKAISFNNPDQQTPPGFIDGRTANIYLSDKLLKQLGEELQELFFKYGHLSFKEKKVEKQAAYTIKYDISTYKEDTDE